MSYESVPMIFLDARLDSRMALRIAREFFWPTVCEKHIRLG